MSLLVTLSLLTALNTTNLTPHKYENTTKQTSIGKSEIANILPSDTPLVGFVSTKVEDWKTLNRFALFKTAFTTAASLLPPNVNLEVVQSSLGDKIALVMMPVKSKQVSIDTNFLMLAPVKDDRLFQPFLANLKANKRQYKGVTILEWKSLKSASTPAKATKSQLQLLPDISNAKTVASLPTIPLPPQVVQPKPTMPSLPDLNKREQSLAIALLPGYVVLASCATPIEQLIDTPRTNTLAQNPNFQHTRQNPHFARSLFTIYENPTLFASILDSLSKEPNSLSSIFGIAAIKPEQFKQYSSIDGLMWVQPSGLHLQFNTYHRQAIARSTFQTNNELLAHIPAPNYSTFTGRNIQQQWQIISTAFNANPTFKDGLAKFYDSVRSSTSLDVERDILAWMDGEYAFFSYPTKQGLFNSAHNKFNLNFGMGFIVQTSDRTAAETSLKKLDAAIKTFDKGISITNHNINNNRITDWSAQQQSLFAYTWIDDKTLLITTGVSAMKELLSSPRHRLAKDYNFTTAINSLPHPNQGYFYMNMGSSLSWLYNLFPDTFNTEYFQIFKQSIGSIYSISATTSTHGNREQSDALIILAPARK